MRSDNPILQEILNRYVKRNQELSDPYAEKLIKSLEKETKGKGLQFTLTCPIHTQK